MNNPQMNQDFKNALWATANKLRGSVDPSDYKYPVLGLIFLKYVSESFVTRQTELAAAFADPANEFYLEDETMRQEELEERDYYKATNTFWVPEQARWSFIQANAKQPNIAVLLDEAMRLVEEDNPKLANLLPKVYVRTTLEQNTLGTLIDLVASIDFGQGEHKGDILGDVYEYFLGNFAGAEGKNAGEFYTTSSIVNVIVEVLAPKKGKLLDPACGAGGMFVSTKKFSTAHGGRVAVNAVFSVIHYHSSGVFDAFLGANQLTSLVILALIFGFFYSITVNSDRVHALLRKIGVTQRSSYLTEWNYVHRNVKSFVVLQLKDGRRLFGFPEVFPSDGQEGHYFIAYPKWQDEANGEVSMVEYLEGVLIPVSEVQWVEFCKKGESDEKENSDTNCKKSFGWKSWGWKKACTSQSPSAPEYSPSDAASATKAN